MTPEILFEQSVSGFPELREKPLSLFMKCGIGKAKINRVIHGSY